MEMLTAVGTACMVAIDFTAPSVTILVNAMIVTPHQRRCCCAGGSASAQSTAVSTAVAQTVATALANALATVF